MGFLFVAAVARLKGDNPLYGSSLIDYVRPCCYCCSPSLSDSLIVCVNYADFGCLHFQAHIEQWIDFASLEN
jgi:hypothetical protein